MARSPYAVWHIFRRNPDFTFEMYAGKGKMTFVYGHCQKYGTETRAKIVMKGLNLGLYGYVVGKCDCFKKRAQVK